MTFHRQRNRGITLIELLVVIAIVLVLIGVVTPVLALAKRRSLVTTEISNMHQLGLAEGLYVQENRDPPTSVDYLVRQGTAPKIICYSPLDYTPNGLTNAFGEACSSETQIFNHRKLSYPNSYFSLREYGLREGDMQTVVEPMPGAGWLVSVTDAHSFNRHSLCSAFFGKYRRLELDGSVHTFDAGWVNYGGQQVWHDLFYFLDASDQWKGEFTSSH